MPTFFIRYTEVSQKYWDGEVEADNEEEAKDRFLDEIQGTDSDDEDVTNSWFDIE